MEIGECEAFTTVDLVGTAAFLDTSLGTCLDLATLFAACFEQAGFHPVICLLSGHAFPGVWLTDDSFADSVIDDALTVRKRVDLNEICLLESTVAVDGKDADVDVAINEGRRNLDDPDRFVYCVDVRRVRMSRIRPLPVRVRATGLLLDAATEPSLTTTVAPPVLFASGAPQDGVAEKPLTPAGRLDRWKRKLLDLSLRNRLLNFQESRSTVPLLFPDLPSLENALAEGKQLEFHPRPLDWQTADRDLNVHLRRTGEDAEKALLMSEFEHRRLRCGLESAELTRRLTEIFRAARSSIEENGANTLYLALGMLVWYETKTSSQPRRAPILLIPIEVQRRSAVSGFTVRRRDEEAMVNVTLLELLRHDFNLQIDGLEPLPEDEAGIDVRLVLDRFRLAVKKIDRWDVMESAHVGLFTFTKFLMWRDMELRTEELKRNKLVSSLINFPIQPFPAASGFPVPERLDDDYRLDETFTPVSADSSQLAAVYASGEGKSFVLHGPPGTGKSQTITNIIAHGLALGKRVLFVAEKMAALNVVQRRLEAVGLGPFCLELHSNKSRKADVLAQLEASLKLASSKPPAEWRTGAQRLSQLRAELNAYVRALHRPRLTGESFFTGVARLVALGKGPRVALDSAMLISVSGAYLAELRDKLRRLVASSRAAGNPAEHRWRFVGTDEWTPEWRDKVDKVIANLSEALRGSAQSVGDVALFLGLPDKGWSGTDLVALKELAELILMRTAFPAALVAATDWDEADAAVDKWITQGRERDRLREATYARFTDRILQLDLDNLAAQRATSAQQWFLPRWLAERRLTKALQAVAKPGHRVEVVHLEREIEGARKLLQQEQLVASFTDAARALLGRFWQDGEADWTSIAGARDWARKVRGLAAQIAGADALRMQELRRRWAAVMAEQPDLLRAGGSYAERLKLVLESVQAVNEHRKSLVSLLRLNEGACWGDVSQPGFIERIADVLSDWREHTGQLLRWCAWRKERSEAISLKLAPLVEAHEQGRLGTDEMEKAFERSFYSGWVDQVMGQEEPLRRFSRQSVEERIATFRALDEQFSRLTCAEINARLSARIPRYEGEPNPGSEVGILRREIQKRTRHMALRTLFQQTRNLLLRLKPCLLMSPISVAQYLDPAFPAFDLVVFDEASQVPTWDAVGAIARGTEVIIVGDPKQLPPTNFFTRGDNPDDEEIATEDLESILDDSLALTIPEMHLRWHYRSRHESLIAFSNYHYYGNELFSFPSPAGDSAVSLRHVAGLYDRGKTQTNRVEAESIVQEVIRRLRSPEGARQSLGVVTFNVYQQRLIEDLLDDARRRFPDIEPHFSSDRNEPVFVKNLENVQGDERDVILFSICYGPDAEGRMSVNFGPLNREGGHRRLNVAITRARQEVVVFTSLHPEQLDLTRTKAVGVHHLRAFLEYARRGTQALREHVRFAKDDTQPSLLVEHLGQLLTARGHRLQTQVGCSGYRIDLAVEDPDNPGQFLLGILCDGDNYQGASTARDRDKLREDVLRGLGWRLHRVWATEWLQDPGAEIERLEAALDAAKVAHPEVRIEGPAEATVPLFARAAMSPPVPEEVPEAGAELQPYRVAQAQPPADATQFDFYEAAAGPVLTQLIAGVVEEEGPISLGLLCQRTAPFWGIGRMTSRVEQRVSSLARRAGVKMTVASDVVFLWPKGVDPETYSDFRVPGDARREAGDLPPEEIANAAVHVLKWQVSLPVDDLVRELARLFGYQRIGQQVDRCLRQGIALLLRRGGAVEQDGSIVGHSEPSS